MNELVVNAVIAIVAVGMLMLYIEWRNSEYTSAITKKVDAVMQKVIDIKNR